jgi:phage terminase large subunit
MKNNLNIYEHIGKNYYEVFEDAYNNKHVHYWLKGGRGSLKSSFAVLYVVYMMTLLTSLGHIVHCVAMRKVKDTIRGSIFNNLLWAISKLGLTEYWNVPQYSPLGLSIGESTIVFRGCHNRVEFERIKSIKFEKGVCRFALFEELTEFDGMDEIMSIIQSIFRDTDFAQAFYMYNPPASKFNWVNIEAKKPVDNRLVHSSTFLDAPMAWLGKVFIEEAKILQKLNKRKYEHMYLAYEIGEGLEIYPNVKIIEISNEKIDSFDKVYRGMDFGFTADATSYVEVYFDRRKDDLYIFDEVYGHNMNNKMIYDHVRPKSKTYLIKADSAEPRTINEMRILGLNIMGCKKGKDSVDHGIKWFQNLNNIYIDRKRCPFAAIDFETYEYEKDANGNVKRSYPKEPHASAACRYALDDIILARKLVGV